MNAIQAITASEFRTQLSEGQYRAVTQATVYLSYGKGDSRRDLQYVTYQPGDDFSVPLTTPGHWYGLEPNPGAEMDPFSASDAVVELLSDAVVTD